MHSLLSPYSCAARQSKALTVFFFFFEQQQSTNSCAVRQSDITWPGPALSQLLHSTIKVLIVQTRGHSSTMSSSLVSSTKRRKHSVPNQPNLGTAQTKKMVSNLTQNTLYIEKLTTSQYSIRKVVPGKQDSSHTFYSRML